jgi:signal transduction histidine kinase
MRVNKYISESGIASRRQADKLISEGRVKINGKRAEIESQVEPGDQVLVNGSSAIPIQNQEHVFERFYRVDSSRKYEGLGMALSTVKEIIAVHEGSITLPSVPLEKTVFEIQLPTRQREQSFLRPTNVPQ